MICVPSEIEKYNEEYGDLASDMDSNYRLWAQIEEGLR